MIFRDGKVWKKEEFEASQKPKQPVPGSGPVLSREEVLGMIRPREGIIVVKEKNMTKNMTKPIEMTEEEWLAKGRELFGDDMYKWKFVCPGCGHVQMAEDFKPYKEQGASPDSARCECIGRYSGGRDWMRGKDGEPGPCNYAAYGLLQISPVHVLSEGKIKQSFAFAEEDNAEET